MAFQLWMADVLRAAGLTVVEVPGWKTRTARYKDGSPRPFNPNGLIAHETQGSLTSSDAGEINVMVNGREGLAGPIAHLYLSRSGTWHVVTAGASNHVRDGWGGIFTGLGNDNLLGVEAQHAKDEPWTQVQYRSYVRGVAAILAHTGWQVEGHKNHQPGDKSDPGFDMDRFRADVAAVQDGDDMLRDEQLTLPKETLLTGETVPASGEVERVDAATALAYSLRNSYAARRAAEEALAGVRELADRPPVQPAPVDVAELVAALTPAMDAAAERALRRVMLDAGTPDGATPAEA